MTAATTGSAFEHREAAAGPDWATLNLVGESRAFRAVLTLLQQWAKVDATVVLRGGASG
ncbi:MAG TPA: hypothetical protein VF308_01455 [Caldimonas sp.]